MARELSGIEKYEVKSKLVKKAFVVAIEEHKLSEPLINENYLNLINYLVYYLILNLNTYLICDF